jgi:Glycosyl hydrolases family 39
MTGKTRSHTLRCISNMLHSCLPFTWCIVAAILACPALAQAQNSAIKITVQPQREGLEVNPLVLRGYNFGNWMPVTEMGKSLATVPAATLRFPAGNAGDEFDLTETSLDIFAALKALVPGEHTAVVQTRVFGDPAGKPTANTPEDAAAAVKMAADRKLKVGIWEIGNEPDLFSKTRGDKTWNADRYCDVFRAQAKAIKAVNPAALIAGPAISGDRPDGSKFLERFVLRCGDVVDVLTWHVYPTGGEGAEDSALSTVKDFNDTAAQYRAVWADASRNPLGYQRKIQYGVTEYGLSWRSNNSKFLADQAGALWAAEGALRMANNGIHIAHYFAYLATSFHGLLDLGGIPRPTYYGFSMLAGLKGKFVSAESEDAKIWVHAIKNAQSLDMVVINAHGQSKDVTLSVDGYVVERVQYFDADIVEEEKDLATLPAKPQLSLPAKSMAHITLKASK